MKAISMRALIQRFFTRRQTQSVDERERAAKAALDALRQNDLSVGAFMRRSEPINKAPGQLKSSPAAQSRNTSNISTYSAAGNSTIDDFASGMIAGATTGDTGSAHLISNDTAAIAIGAAIHQSQH